MKKYIQENIAGIFIILFLILSALLFLDIENIQEQILNSGIWGPIILIFIKIITVVFAPLSGAALYPLSGAIFGFWLGLLYVVIGDTIGFVIAFYISRIFGQKSVERFLNKKDLPTVNKIIKVVETTPGLIFARICFIAMPEIFAYAVGLTKTKFSRFFIVNFIIEIFPVAFLVWGGDYVSLLKNPLFMFLFIILGAVFVFIGGYVFYQISKKMEGKIDNKI
jgi:uncharacterized membrane protein YdjX (TVP38/TMEM64 family)